MYHQTQRKKDQTAYRNMIIDSSLIMMSEINSSPQHGMKISAKTGLLSNIANYMFTNNSYATPPQHGIKIRAKTGLFSNVANSMYTFRFTSQFHFWKISNLHSRFLQLATHY